MTPDITPVYRDVIALSTAALHNNNQHIADMLQNWDLQHLQHLVAASAYIIMLFAEKIADDNALTPDRVLDILYEELRCAA